MSTTISQDHAAAHELRDRLTAAAADLPPKLRVHELAKRAGLTSKEVLAALAAQGVVIGSSASSVTAETATDLLTSLQPAIPEPVAAAEAPARPARRRSTAKSKAAETAAAEAAAAETAAAEAAAAETAVAETATTAEAAPAPPRRRRATRATAPAVPVESAPVEATAQPVTAPAAAPPAPVEVATAPAAPQVEAPTRTRRGRATRSAGAPAVEAPIAPTVPVEPPANEALTAALADLPSRSRVHELAKRAGVKPKDILERLALQGVIAKSAASVIAAADATILLTALLADAVTEPAAPAAPTTPGFVAPLFMAPSAPVSTTASSSPETGESATEEAPAAPSGRSRSRRGRGRGAAEPQPENLQAGPDEDTVEATGEDTSTVDTESRSVESTEQAESDESRRRRRRGRRGRGRTGDRDGDSREDTETDASATDDEGAPVDRTAAGDDTGVEDPEDEDGTDNGGQGSASRRRRRRRRGSNADEVNRQDDPADTVVHVREVRSAESQVQGVRGSTRLEAKRQRRRESRDTRRRPQILTEAEFLARRESVHRVMAVRQRGELAQVALLEDGVLVEHFVSRAGSASMIGNVYLGRVQNVLPSMEAAFIDIGRGRNAVLYAGEVNWDAAGLAGKSRKIETALSSGDSILVQVSKDPVGHKGARLTTQISLPGRFLVYVPNGGATGISRKLPDTERKRLKAILDRIVPEDAGVIIRTAAEGVSEEELAHDVERLKEQWEDILASSESAPGKTKQSNPEQLYSEPDTLIKVVRDLFNSDITELIIDGDQAWESLSSYVEQVAPELAPRVSRFSGRTDVFAAHRIDEQIAKALERKVHLPSGGSLVIDRTEAMTVVDVNTGKYTGSGGNLEETVTKNNLEAAEEVVRQLRLRDIGGIIVVDFIDMVLESNRELVVRRLTECLGRDRTRHQVAEVTSLGLVQMTRKKMGTGLVEAFSEPCPHCQGRGIVLHDAPIDHSPEYVPERNQPSSENEGRSRRGRGRDRDRTGQSAPAPVAEVEIPLVQVVAPRPPDPRGPKPPARTSHGSGDLDLFGNRPAVADEDQHVDQPTVLDVGAIVDQVLAARGSGTADAVTAEVATEVAAVVEAEEAVQAVVEAEQATEGTGEPTERGRGRRRGSRGGRSRGARADEQVGEQSATASVEPAAEPDLGFPGTAEVETVPLFVAEIEVPAVPQLDPETEPAVAAAEVEDPTEVFELPKKAARVRKPAAKRGAKAKADAAAANGAAAETNGGSHGSGSHGGPATEAPAPAAQAVEAPAAPQTAAQEPVAALTAVTAAPAAAAAPAAPRRRRAASRPAGPPQS
ncbi:Rne/Rng family ribonuclease [Nakamurella silvestris]|nr:Rne/Rng family ribonuclease [Nakamurella silvestris]